jgi:hypothetical protein
MRLELAATAVFQEKDIPDGLRLAGRAALVHAPALSALPYAGRSDSPFLRIRQLKQIHSATHPAAELLTRLVQEAEREEEL